MRYLVDLARYDIGQLLAFFFLILPDDEVDIARYIRQRRFHIVQYCRHHLPDNGEPSGFFVGFARHVGSNRRRNMRRKYRRQFGIARRKYVAVADLRPEDQCPQGVVVFDEWRDE